MLRREETSPSDPFILLTKTPLPAGLIASFLAYFERS